MTTVASCRKLTGPDEEDAGRPAWLIRLPGGRELEWTEFYTGPLVLDESELAALCETLVGTPVAGLAAASAREIRPYTRNHPPDVAILMHSATRTTKGFDGDLTDLADGRQPYDVATYLETRVVYLGRKDDLAVGRTAPWKDAVQAVGLGSVDVGHRDHYYLGQALLLAAKGWNDGTDRSLGPLLDFVQRHPQAVVALYALDTEMQAFLLWLRRRSGVDEIFVDANSAVVASVWNQKNHLHPTVARASELPEEWASRPAGELVDAEHAMSGFRQILGAQIGALPGYTIERRGASVDEFQNQILVAAELLRSRYGLVDGCLKPSEAGDGARIVHPIGLADREHLMAIAARAYPHGDDYLLEAEVDYCEFMVGTTPFILAPSGHIKFGQVQEGLTIQFMNGMSWEGNAYFDEGTAHQLGISSDMYESMRADLHAIRNSFYGERSVLAGCYEGLVTGGIDFAVGYVGGRFGDEGIVAPTDFNLSSHGAEYMRAFHDRVRLSGWGGPYVATRVFRPSMTASLQTVRDAVARATPVSEQAAVVASVPGRWGMVAVSSVDTLGAIVAVSELVEALRAEGLVKLA